MKIRYIGATKRQAQWKTGILRRHRDAARIALVGCVLTLCPATRGESRVSGLDANDQVRKMVATYQNAQSYTERSTAQIYNGSSTYNIVQTSDLKYRAKNQFSVSSDDPSLGTYLATCDGRYVTLYTAKQNAYTKRLVAATMRETVDKLMRASLLLLRTSVAQVLNPISFTIARGMPDECKDFRVVGEETLDNRTRVLVVSGQADGAWLARLANGAKAESFSKREVKLWIDPARHVLLKAQITLEIRGRNVMRIIEKHDNIVLNPPLNEADFVFKPPKGSEEKYQERREVY